MQAVFNRRDFVKASAGFALTVGFTLPGAQESPSKDGRFEPNAYLRVHPDGRVVVQCGPVEMGQGVLTAIPMLITEELDADWALVSVEQAPVGKAYVNSMFGAQVTGGSTTIRAHWESMRKAGAGAREMLVGAASARLGVPAQELRTDKGRVFSPDGRSLGYGELTKDAANQPVPVNPRVKDPRQFKLIGQSVRRLDTPGKVNGSARYGIDVQVPGLLVAVMARTPLGAKLTSADENKARAVKGVRHVVRLPNGVAVVADGYWAAKSGRDALAVTWDTNGAQARLSSSEITAMLVEGATAGGVVAKNVGDISQAGSTQVVEAQYEAPMLAHACMEPLNCTAWVRGDDVELWVGTQSQGP